MAKSNSVSNPKPLPGPFEASVSRTADGLVIRQFGQAVVLTRAQEAELFDFIRTPRGALRPAIAK